MVLTLMNEMVYELVVATIIGSLCDIEGRDQFRRTTEYDDGTNKKARLMFMNGSGVNETVKAKVKVSSHKKLKRDLARAYATPA